jgi:VCBS repeat-containing protein
MRTTLLIAMLLPSLALRLPAAPTAVPDTFTTLEDTPAGGAASTLLSASFESGGGAPSFTLPATWQVIDLKTTAAGGSNSYPADGSGRNWRAVDYDPATSVIPGWRPGTLPAQAGGINAFTGAAEFLTGIVPGGPNTVNTYLFRNTFTMTAAQAAHGQWTFNMLADDGCIIYINGVERARLNYPDNVAVNPDAMVGGNGGDESNYTQRTLDLTGVFVTGQNVIAIELHQNSESSSDVGLDFQMTPADSGLTSGFTGVDDAFFGTNQPNFSTQNHVPTGGFNGTGGLRVQMGNVFAFGGSSAVSGAWRRTFTLAAPANLELTFRYRMLCGRDYEAAEFQEVICDVNGTQYGTVTAPSNHPSVELAVGNGNGGNPFDTGWKQRSFTIPLAAGTHTLSLGGYGNQGTQNFQGTAQESFEVFFDDVVLAVPGTTSLLANDTGGVPPVTAAKVSDPANGTAVVNADGTFSYTPNPDWSGVDSFTYRAIDSTGGSDPATVTITVTPVNDPPVGLADAYTTTQGAALTVNAADGVLKNDTDVDHPASALSAVSATTPGNGTVTLNANGSFTYTPTALFSGATTFTYRVSDGVAQSAPVTVTITVTDTPDPPVAVNDSYVAVRNTPLVVTALTGGSTTEEVLPYKAADWRYYDSLVLAERNLGTAWRSDAYTENANWKTGAAELGYGDGDEATVINDNPDPAFDSAAGDKFAAAYFRRRVNVANVFNVTSVEVSVIYDDALAFYLNGGPGNRTSNLPDLTTMPELAWDYFPQTNVNDNSTQTFSLPGSVLQEGSNLIAAEVHQNGPTSSDLSFDLRMRVTRALAASLLANDSDPDPGETATLVAELVTPPQRGSVQINPNGTFTYTPETGFVGTDLFTYRARDASGRVSNTATAAISVVIGPNAAPVAVADTLTVAEDGVLELTAPGILANDTDAENDPLTAALATPPTRGTLTLNADGSLRYTPQPDFSGSDSFTYRAVDSRPSAPATVTINVTPVNDVPVARADNYAGDPGSPFTVAAAQGVLANDTDADPGTVLTAELVTPPAAGTLVLNADGSFTFTAPSGGSYSFTYRAKDETSASDPATVTMVLNAAPVAAADAHETDEDSPLSVTAPGVLGNDSDAEGDAITAELVSGPQHGSLTLNSDGSFAYSPSANFFGSDSFVYRAADATRKSAPATVSLTVRPVNDAPVGVADTYGVRVDTPISISAVNGVLRNDTDVDNATLTAVLDTAPEAGELTLRPDGSFDYAPPAGFSGTQTFRYRVSDGALESGPVTVTLNVTTNLNTVVISEIMYNPPGASGVLEEFIEIYNFGDAAVDLSGWEFTKGVNYVFPSGLLLAGKSFLAIPADRAVFVTKYGAAAAVTPTGWGTLSRLSNGGELIRLKNAGDVTVDEVEYSDSGDWAVRKIVNVWDATNTPGRTPANGLDTDPGLEWVTAADPDPEIGNPGGASIQLINLAMSNDAGQNWSAANPSPGAANASVARANSAPFITEVLHAPAVPTRTQQVTVTARITDELATGISASVYYRTWLPSGTTPATAYAEVLMRDNGLSGDGAAGDGVFGAVIPAQAINTVVEFYVRASDGSANVRAWPPPTLDLNGANPQLNANCLYQVNEEVWTDHRSLYQVVMTGADNASWNAGLADRQSNVAPNCTVIFRQGGEYAVRYRGGIRTRGNSSRSDTPVNLRLDIPGDIPWNGRTAFTMNYKYSYSQFVGSRLMEAAGVPSEKSNVVGMRINGVNRLLDQNTNRTYGYYCDLMPRGGETINEWFPDNNDGNGYGKIRGNVRWGTSTLPVIGSNGWAEGGYVNEGWWKQSNAPQNDWTDLHAWLVSMNAGTAETFHETIAGTVDIDQWCRFLAISTIINHAETNMANGDDDDYSVYFGLQDRLCRIIAHDLDTCFNLRAIGLGDEEAPPTMTIYQCTAANYPTDSATLPQMDKFYRNPVTGRKFKAALRQYLNTLFAKPAFDAWLDTMLDPQWLTATPNPGGDAIRNHIKSFMDTRRTTIETFLPKEFTAVTTLPVQNGFARTTSATNLGALGGRIDPVRTAEVRVNGIRVTTNPYGATAADENTWSAGGAVTLRPGLNALVCTAHDEAGTVFETRTVNIWFDATGTNRSGTLAASETWSAAAGPYIVTASLTVPNNVVLTIEPGTTVFVASGAAINVSGGGRIVAEGTPAAGITFTRNPSGSGTWNGIVITGATTEPSRIGYATFGQNGDTAVHARNGANVELHHLTFLNTGMRYLELDASSFRVSDCVFPDNTAGFEPVHGTGGIAPGGRGIIERCRFGRTTGYNDSIDFTGGNRPGPILHVLDCTFAGSDDDILDLDSTDAWIEGNVFVHAHRNGSSPDSASAISGGSDNADYSQVTVINNLFYDCDNAITMKQGDQPQGGSGVLLNNTIVRTTKAGGIDGGSGVVNFDDDDFAGEGKGFYLEGNVIWDAENLTRNYVPANSRLVMVRNLLPVAPPTGVEASGNVVGTDPFLNLSLIMNPATATVEQVMAALRPQSCSPLIGAGPLGGNLGADLSRPGFRVQLPSASRLPASFSILAGMGGSFAPTGQPAWNYGYSAYRYRIDGGAESPDLPVGTPLLLSGLAAGEHTMAVRGLRDSGLWEETAATVNFRVEPGIPTVTFSEVLADPLSGPDQIELHNWGSEPAVLDGCRITDDPALPDRFVLPPGSVIPPGAWLVIDSTQSGFGLDRTGEMLRLTTATGALIDELQFGLQIPGFSVARSGGAWRLAQPTPGAANTAVCETTATAALRINEWLGSNALTVDSDFVELYNPDSRPADISGWRMSQDYRNEPAASVFPPLSFMAGKGYLPLIADGRPELGAHHLPFKVSRIADSVALLNPQGQPVDIITVLPGNPDVSQGRNPDGGTAIVYLPVPTPGYSNASDVSADVTVINGLRITELMFDPPSSAQAEYIEFRNISAAPLTVTGVNFASGVTFSFPALVIPANGYAVITQDLAKFTAQFPGVAAVPWTGGRLDNNGESIRIETAGYGLGILDFRYEGNWFPATRAGASLEIINPLADRTNWDLRTSWQPGVPSPGGPSAFGVVTPPDTELAGGEPMVIDAVVSAGPYAVAEVSVAWSNVSGPAPAVFTAPNSGRTNVNFPGPGRYEIRLTATGPGGVTSADSTVVTVTESYEQWAARLMAGLPADQRTATADADADGFTNFMEFALGGNPRTSDAASLVRLVNGSLPLSITWTRNPFAVPAPLIRPEASSDLVNWSTEAVGSVLESTSGDLETWTGTDAAPAGSPQRWLRLRITQP